MIDKNIDPFLASVIHGALEDIALEMGQKLMRMRYSSIIRERWKNGKTIRYMVTQSVWKYINDNKLFIK